jgi:hypothetical protein
VQLVQAAPDAAQGEQRPPAQDAPDANDARAQETRKFLRWAKGKRQPDPAQFSSAILSDADKRALLGEEVKNVRIVPEGAREPLPPVPTMLEITEADIERAIAAWDEALPDYRGLLVAESSNAGEAL